MLTLQLEEHEHSLHNLQLALAKPSTLNTHFTYMVYCREAHDTVFNFLLSSLIVYTFFVAFFFFFFLLPSFLTISFAASN